ncbi:MAG: hypothetical protein ABH872_04770 [Candidatus Omnitrophota bacterium]
MPAIHKVPDVTEKLSILSRDSQYDLACACGTSKAYRRHRSRDDKWIYPVTLPQGGTTYLFKTLVSTTNASTTAGIAPYVQAGMLGGARLGRKILQNFS